MSVGGILGGLFNAIVAPFAFNLPMEYFLVLVACLFLPYKFLRNKNKFLDVFPEFNKEALPLLALIFVVGLGVDVAFSKFGDALLRDRSFYGSMAVRETIDPETKALTHIFSHGSTNHGAQVMNPKAEQKVARGYYYAEGLFGDVMKGYALHNPSPVNLGMVGLGAGAMSVYARPEDTLTFYEIDPAVVAIAENPEYFTYWQQTPAKKNIVLGDARLSLNSAPDHHYDVLVVDAFSSDAIPINLMTQEAINLYLQKTKPTGAIALHISNRYLDLRHVIAGYTLPSGYQAYCGQYGLDSRANLNNDFKYPHVLCLIAKKDTLPDVIKNNPLWQETVRDPSFHPWTDDYSNIVSVFQLK
jgi:hypothetical protein